MNMEILSQFPSPPVPNLPALAMAMAPVMPQHQQPMMAKPAVSMAMPTPAPPVMAMQPVVPMQAPTTPGFVANFPPAQVPLYQRRLILSSSCYVSVKTAATPLDLGHQSG